MLVIGFNDGYKPLPDSEYLSEMQDREAIKSEPDVNKLALINLQLLALAFEKMPSCFDVKRAQWSARNQLSRLTDASAKKRAQAIIGKLLFGEEK